MRKIKTTSVIGLLLACFFALTFYKAGAQAVAKNSGDGDSAKPRKHIIKARNPKYSEVGEYAYWVQADSVYNCQIYSGQKIALSDIDFGAKEIVKSETLEEGSNDNVYIITLNLKKGEKSYSCGCVMRELSGDVRSSNKAVKIVERSEAMAELEFTVLHRMALERQIAQMPADTTTPAPLVIDDNRSAIDKILEADSIKKGKKKAVDPNPSPANDVPPPTDPSTATTGDFDGHLLSLINGLKDDFTALKGAAVPGADQYEAKVLLDGSVNTRVTTGFLGHTFLLANFGEFSTMDAALPVYQRVSGLVNDSRKMPVSMAKQDELVSEIGRTNSWLPFGDVDPGLKGFSIVVELVKSVKFDKKTFASTDIYFVQLKIDK